VNRPGLLDAEIDQNQRYLAALVQCSVAANVADWFSKTVKNAGQLPKARTG
jgi:hypothetical protein